MREMLAAKRDKERIMKKEKYDFKKIAEAFEIEGKFLSCEPYGMGHINDTFKLTTSEKTYILQRINHDIFKNVDALMNNIKLVTEYQKAEIEKRGGDPDREALSLISAKDGKPYYFDGTNYFRIYKFIDQATSFQIVENPVDFYNAGKAFGAFQKMLSNFDATKIYETIPDFHNTKKRFEALKDAVKADRYSRKKEVEKEIEFAMQRENIVSAAVDMIESGDLPLKVTHNDTKLNNVLIDNQTHEGLCVIDLDTIMPGSSIYDFGDSIRFGTNPAEEDEKDLTKVVMSMPLYEEYAKGFLEAVGDGLTETEADMLPMGCILMTFECGIRFLTDYLNGDTYFKTHREKQNLDRTRTQFKLVSDMEKNFSKMKDVIRKYYNR